MVLFHFNYLFILAPSRGLWDLSSPVRELRSHKPRDTAKKKKKKTKEKFQWLHRPKYFRLLLEAFPNMAPIHHRSSLFSIYLHESNSTWILGYSTFLRTSQKLHSHLQAFCFYHTVFSILNAFPHKKILPTSK